MDGGDIDIEFESICFHSDTPGCIDIASKMRASLLANGVRIAPVSEVFSQEPKPLRDAK